MSAEDLLARADARRHPDTEVMYADDDGDLIADLAAELERLRAERDALRSVVRHYHQGDVLSGSGWSSDGPEWQTPPSALAPAAVPVTEAEAAAIRNAIRGTGQ